MTVSLRTAFLLAPALLAAGCAGGGGDGREAPRTEAVYERPALRFDGETDDLLTGGLGFEGLNSPAPPAGASLRTTAIHMNFRALIDVTEEGGFTRLYGPSKDALKIAGWEYAALLKIDGMTHPFAVAVAIPDSFDTDEPCLILAPSSGSRGLYGAIGTAGAAGLARGCAVAFTDKATGTGFVHLDSGEGYGLDFALTGDPAAMLFSLDAAARAEAPRGEGAVAVKHAHSGENVERYWGAATLAAGEYALGMLNRHFAAAAFTRDNTLVLAVSISNGGKAAMMAAEQDRTGLIDGVVASEPNFAPLNRGRVVVGGREVAGAGRAMLDYATAMNVYAPCAALAPDLAGEPGVAASLFAAPVLSAWCARLAEDGLVAGESLAAQASDALVVVRNAGFARPTDPLFHYGVAIRLWPALAVAYANAYGRYGVADAPCGAYYAFATGGAQRPASEAEKRGLAAVSSGAPPTGGVDILYKDKSPGAAYDAALCFRALWENDADLRAGAAAAGNSGDLGAVPAIVLHGRADSLIPVDHASRPYMATAQSRGALRYYEIEGGQHFDSFLMLPDLAAHFAPMQPYLERSLDLMLAHLKTGAAPPPSQVVRTPPRGAGPLGAAHLGAIQSDPGDDAIEVKGGAIFIPQ